MKKIIIILIYVMSIMSMNAQYNKPFESDSVVIYDASQLDQKPKYNLNINCLHNLNEVESCVLQQVILEAIIDESGVVVFYRFLFKESSIYCNTIPNDLKIIQDNFSILLSCVIGKSVFESGKKNGKNVKYKILLPIKLNWQ